MPQLSVAGIRVVGAGLGANGSELRPFNERPGTTLALALQAPAGAGIVEIDDDESRLDVFSDDKGQSLLEEGRVGPFPKVAEDGTAGLVEIEVRARPSAGAASVSAQGTLAVTLANGSKPVRMPNVRLEAARTLKLPTATITIKEASSDEESTTVTFGLSRAVMNTIRSIRFLDAKGTAIESRRTSSGYMNDNAEMRYSVKTKEKAATVELDVWQTPRVVKVPFRVQVGLGGLATAGRPAGAAETAPGEPAAARAAPAPRVPPVIGPGEGADNIDAVVKQLQSSALKGNGAGILSVIYPDDRPAFGQAVAMIVTFQVMSAIDDAKAAEKVQKDVETLLAKHKIKTPLSREPAEIFKDVNLPLFVTDALAYLKTRLKKGDDPSAALPMPRGRPENVKIEGDGAVAQLGGKNVKFTRVSNRWFIRLE